MMVRQGLSMWYSVVSNVELAKGLVINYGERGATKWENSGSETFCTPTSRQGKTFHSPPLKEWKLYATPPPLQYG